MTKPEIFWKDNKENFPCLHYCFKRIFCIPASSVPCEHLFSKAVYNVSKIRNKLLPEKGEQITFLYANE